MKKIGMTFVLLLGSLVNLFAGEGVVLYAALSPNGQFTNVFIDAKDENGNPGQDGIEDTILVLGGTTIDHSIYRRLNPKTNPNARVTFDDRLIEDSTDGFNYIWSEALKTIDGKPARPNQGR